MKKKNIKQITGDERVAMSAPRTRCTKVKGIVKAAYKASSAIPRTRSSFYDYRHNEVQGNSTNHQGQMGFVGYKTKPRLKSIKLSIAPVAGRKIKYWLSLTNDEFAGFGVCGDIKEPLRVTDFVLVEQRTGGAHADLEDLAIANYFTDMGELGLKPVQYGRIWFHTHPFGDNVPSPSWGDKTTFEESFGNCDWSIMLIFSDFGRAYAELQVLDKDPSNFLLDVIYESLVSKEEEVSWMTLFDTFVKKAPRVNVSHKITRMIKKTVDKGLTSVEGAIMQACDEFCLTQGEIDYEFDLQQDQALEEAAHTEAVNRIMRIGY